MSDELAAWTDGGALIALRRRRGFRVGVTQGLAAAAGIFLGVALPSIRRGPQMQADTVHPLLVALGGGLVSFIALVFSLLFLVVQYGSTTFSPRLTLFRDDPLVWRTFSVFVGVFIYVTTASLRMGSVARVTALVPILAVVMVVVSLLLTRRLQMRALGMVQLNATLEEVRGRGERVLRKLYFHDVHRPVEHDDLPPATQVVHWDQPHAVLRQLDLPALHRIAIERNAVVCVHVGVGDELRRRSVVLTVHGGSAPIDQAFLRGSIDAGHDRTFQQDPLLAFRLLSDIGVRALSPAVNDPVTAVAAIANVHDLLVLVADRELDVGRIGDHAGALRVQLSMPDWERFVAAAVDDFLHYGRDVPLVRARVDELLADVLEAVPAHRAAALVGRRERLASLADTANPAHVANPDLFPPTIPHTVVPGGRP